MNDVSEMDALSVSISQKKCKNWLGIFKLTAMDEHLAEFIASSVLTGIMTYANWRLSAEMRLFSKIKKERGDACTSKMEGGRKERWEDKPRSLDICFHLLCGIC